MNLANDGWHNSYHHVTTHVYTVPHHVTTHMYTVPCLIIVKNFTHIHSSLTGVHRRSYTRLGWVSHQINFGIAELEWRFYRTRGLPVIQLYQSPKENNSLDIVLFWSSNSLLRTAFLDVLYQLFDATANISMCAQSWKCQKHQKHLWRCQNFIFTTIQSNT